MRVVTRVAVQDITFIPRRYKKVFCVSTSSLNMSTVLVTPKDAKEIILLPHTRTGEICQFILSQEDKLYELRTMKRENKESLLYRDEIISDAPIHVATPFDPTFFLLFYLDASSQEFKEQDELLEVVPERIKHIVFTHLPKVCDSLENMDSPYYRLSLVKIQALLRGKISLVKESLPKSILDKLPTSEQMHALAKEKAALEIVSSYLSVSLSETLSQSYDFSLLIEQTSDYVNPNEFIKEKATDASNTTAKKIKKGSKGVEALKKVNTRGMKSMTSFFAKKS